MRYFFLTPWRFEKGAPTEDLFSFYRDRVAKYIPSEHVFPRAMPPNKQAATQFLQRELKKLDAPGTVVVALDENGKTMSSSGLADFLRSLEVKGVRQTLFCVGGAYGLPAGIESEHGNVTLISLSPMTFPHEMALVMLMEQVYRARTIMGGHPYHHEDASELFQSRR